MELPRPLTTGVASMERHIRRAITNQIVNPVHFFSTPSVIGYQQDRFRLEVRKKVAKELCRGIWPHHPQPLQDVTGSVRLPPENWCKQVLNHEGSPCLSSSPIHGAFREAV